LDGLAPGINRRISLDVPAVPMYKQNENSNS
jgi:hypothetical protein